MATKKSSKAVQKRMHEFKNGEKMGSGSKIKNSKQAVAIGLNEARKAGANIPPKPAKKKAAKKTATKTFAVKKSAAKNSTAKKAPAKKAAAKTASKKTAAKKR